MTQDPRDRRIRKGYVIIGVILLSAIAIFNLDAVVDRLRGFIDIVAIVSETRGVRVGSPVSVEGVEVGRVTEVDFAPQGGAGAVAVHIRLEDDARAIVRQGSEASTARRRFIGESVVILSAGPVDAAPIEDGDTLGPSSDPDLATLMERTTTFPATLDSLNMAIGELQRLAETRRPMIDDMLDRLAAVTAEADILQRDLEGGSLAGLLGDPTLGARIARIRDHVDQLAGMTGDWRGATGDEALGGSLERLGGRADRLGAELARLEARIADGQGVVGRLQTDSALAVAMDGVLAQIDSLRAEGLGFALRMLKP